MKAWYEDKPLRKRIGLITDTFGEYIELKDLETGKYVIRHISKVELIKN